MVKFEEIQINLSGLSSLERDIVMEITHNNGFYCSVGSVKGKKSYLMVSDKERNRCAILEHDEELIELDYDQFVNYFGYRHLDKQTQIDILAQKIEDLNDKFIRMSAFYGSSKIKLDFTKN